MRRLVVKHVHDAHVVEHAGRMPYGVNTVEVLVVDGGDE